MATFLAQQITRSATISLPAPRDRVFPLFEPLGEKLWAHDWDPEMLYPASGETQEGAVFTTQHDGEPVKIWTIIAHDPEQAHVRYFNVLPGSHTTVVDVRCEADDAAVTSAHVTYTLTALTPAGNAHLDSLTPPHYQDYIASWETAITHYLLHNQLSDTQ